MAWVMGLRREEDRWTKRFWMGEAEGRWGKGDGGMKNERIGHGDMGDPGDVVRSSGMVVPEQRHLTECLDRSGGPDRPPQFDRRGSLGSGNSRDSRDDFKSAHSWDVGYEERGRQRDGRGYSGERSQQENGWHRERGRYGSYGGEHERGRSSRDFQEPGNERPRSWEVRRNNRNSSRNSDYRDDHGKGYRQNSYGRSDKRREKPRRGSGRGIGDRRYSDHDRKHRRSEDGRWDHDDRFGKRKNGRFQMKSDEFHQNKKLNNSLSDLPPDRPERESGVYDRSRRHEGPFIRPAGPVNGKLKLEDGELSDRLGGVPLRESSQPLWHDSASNLLPGFNSDLGGANSRASATTEDSTMPENSSFFRPPSTESKNEPNNPHVQKERSLYEKTEVSKSQQLPKEPGTAVPNEVSLYDRSRNLASVALQNNMSRGSATEEDSTQGASQTFASGQKVPEVPDEPMDNSFRPFAAYLAVKAPNAAREIRERSPPTKALPAGQDKDSAAQTTSDLASARKRSSDSTKPKANVMKEANHGTAGSDEASKKKHSFSSASPKKRDGNDGKKLKNGRIPNAQNKKAFVQTSITGFAIEKIANVQKTSPAPEPQQSSPELQMDEEEEVLEASEVVEWKKGVVKTVDGVQDPVAEGTKASSCQESSTVSLQHSDKTGDVAETGERVTQHNTETRNSNHENSNELKRLHSEKIEDQSSLGDDKAAGTGQLGNNGERSREVAVDNASHGESQANLLEDLGGLGTEEQQSAKDPDSMKVTEAMANEIPDRGHELNEALTDLVEGSGGPSSRPEHGKEHAERKLQSSASEEQGKASGEGKIPPSVPSTEDKERLAPQLAEEPGRKGKVDIAGLGETIAVPTHEHIINTEVNRKRGRGPGQQLESTTAGQTIPGKEDGKVEGESEERTRTESLDAMVDVIRDQSVRAATSVREEETKLLIPSAIPLMKRRRKSSPSTFPDVPESAGESVEQNVSHPAKTESRQETPRRRTPRLSTDVQRSGSVESTPNKLPQKEASNSTVSQSSVAKKSRQKHLDPKEPAEISPEKALEEKQSAVIESPVKAPRKKSSPVKQSSTKKKARQAADACGFCGQSGDRLICQAELIRIAEVPQPFHRNCATWSPLVVPEQNWRGVKEAMSESKRRKCIICKDYGASLACMHNRIECCKPFHFHCGVFNGATYTSGYKTYCPEHAEMNRSEGVVIENAPAMVARSVHARCKHCQEADFDLRLGPLLTCKKCTIFSSHAKCLDPPLPTSVVPKNFTCRDCNGCGHCGERVAEERMECGGCCRPFHKQCAAKNAQSLQELQRTGKKSHKKQAETKQVETALSGRTSNMDDKIWLCATCTRGCLHCSETVPKDSRAICKNCTKLYCKKNFCPICDTAYPDEEQNFIFCDSCETWVHNACSGLGGEELEEFVENEGLKWTCRVCELSSNRTSMIMKNRIYTFKSGFRIPGRGSEISMRELELEIKYIDNKKGILKLATSGTGKRTGLIPGEKFPGDGKGLSVNSKERLDSGNIARIIQRKKGRANQKQPLEKIKQITASRKIAVTSHEVKVSKPKLDKKIEKSRRRPKKRQEKGIEGEEMKSSIHPPQPRDGAVIATSTEQEDQQTLESVSLPDASEIVIKPDKSERSFQRAARGLAVNHDMCYACGGSGSSSTPLRFCIGCAEGYHEFCVRHTSWSASLPGRAMETSFRSEYLQMSGGLELETGAAWRCPDCSTSCSKCNQETDENDLYCSICSEAFHVSCAESLGFSVPSENPGEIWSCGTCSACNICRKPNVRGRTTFSLQTGGPTDSASLCTSCLTAFSKWKACSVCDKPPHGKEILGCSKCLALVHKPCDAEGVSVVTGGSIGSYVCKICNEGSGLPSNPCSDQPAGANPLSPAKTLQESEKEAESIHQNGVDPDDEQELDFTIDLPDVSTWNVPEPLTRICELCHTEDEDSTVGRFIPLRNGLWVHVMCALWSSEAMETEWCEGFVANIASAIHRGKSLKCTLCKKIGATVGCVESSCKSNYHLRCSMQAGAKFIDEEGGYKLLYCKKHAEGKGTDGRMAEIKEVNRRLQADITPPGERARTDTALMVRCGSLILVNPGRIVPHMLAYQTKKNLFPVGYQAIRKFYSMKDPRKRCRYYFSITGDLDTGPLFCIQSEEEAEWSVIDTSPERAWNAVLKRVVQARSFQQLHESWHRLGKSKVSRDEALLAFGLSTLSVRSVLEQLPDAARTINYDFEFFVPATTIIYNASGGARSEGRISRHEKQKSSLTAGVKDENTETQSQAKESDAGKNVRLSNLPAQVLHKQMLRVWKAKTQVRVSGIQGLGLFALGNFEANEMVIEYCGELIRPQHSDRREAYYDSRGIGCYMFRLEDDAIIDATMTGNYARFINHSCDPNCYSRSIAVDGRRAIVIITKRPIKVNEEFTYDYMFNIDNDETKKLKCNCGAANCHIYLN